MNTQLAESIGSVIGVIENFGNVIYLGSNFVWLVGFYILFQMFKLKFLKLLMTAECLAIVYWFWSNLYYFTGVPEEQNSSLTRIVAIAVTETLLRVMPLLVGTTGAIMGVKFLQNKWKGQDASQSSEPTSLNASD